MVTHSERGADVRIPPPLVYLIGIGIGVVIGRCTDLLHCDVPPVWRVAGSIAAGALGVGLMLGAVGKFKATGQNPKPWLPSPEIISTGIYGFTRNPMYVAMALLQAAIGTALSNWWIVILVVPVLAAVYLVAVRHEETYMTETFGDTYRQYTRSVRRWI